MRERRTIRLINYIVLTMLFVMSGVLVGCKGREAASPPFQLTWTAVLYTAKPPNDAVIKKIEEATNTQLQINWLQDNLKEDKINIALATGSLTKIMTIQDITNKAFLNAVHAGAFWEIGPYLQEFPNLSRMNETILKNTSIDGKIYGIYRERDLSRQGIIYRKDWLDYLGLEAPRSVGDLYQIMLAFTQDDPDGDGEDNTIGLVDRSDLKFGAFKTLSSYFGTPNEWGFKDGELLPEFMFDGYMSTMKFMRMIYRENLINDQFVVTSKQQQWDRFISGQAGVYIGNMDDATNLYSQAVKINPDVQLDLINRIAGPSGEYHVWSQAGHNGIFVFPKEEVADEVELKQILGFFDKLAEPELFNLMNHGIEGVHYHKVDDQHIEYLRGTGDLREAEVRPLLSLVGIQNRTLKLVGDPLREKAEELNEDNLNILVHNPAEALYSETMNEIGDALRDMIQNATYEYILGAIDEDDFKQVLEDWRASGGNKVIAEINAAYKKANQTQG